MLGGCGDKVSDKDVDEAIVSVSQARAILQDKPGAAKAVDSRSPAEYADGHIPGAVNLDLATVSDRKDAIDPALARYKTLVVYGEDPGSGSARAMAKRLMRSGAKDVRLLGGGFLEWKGAGLRVEQSARPPSAPAPATK